MILLHHAIVCNGLREIEYWLTDGARSEKEWTTVSLIMLGSEMNVA